MKKELNRLMKLAGTPDFDIELDRLHERYKNDPQAKNEISAFIKTGIAASAARMNAISVKVQLAELSEMISLSYIAKHYFNKTNAWISQRINGHKVNGKPVRFTPEEIETLNNAFKDIGKKIGGFSIQY